jgi:hypothetical protein
MTPRTAGGADARPSTSSYAAAVTLQPEASSSRAAGERIIVRPVPPLGRNSCRECGGPARRFLELHLLCCALSQGLRGRRSTMMRRNASRCIPTPAQVTRTSLWLAERRRIRPGSRHLNLRCRVICVIQSGGGQLRGNKRHRIMPRHRDSSQRGLPIVPSRASSELRRETISPRRRRVLQNFADLELFSSRPADLLRKAASAMSEWSRQVRNTAVPTHGQHPRNRRTFLGDLDWAAQERSCPLLRGSAERQTSRTVDGGGREHPTLPDRTTSSPESLLKHAPHTMIAVRPRGGQ